MFPLPESMQPNLLSPLDEAYFNPQTRIRNVVCN
jgi:hypothetical protein